MPGIAAPVLSALPKTGARVAVVLRHAERHPVYDLSRHEDALLTNNGHRDAATAGADLHKTLGGAIAVHHSPVERCAQTARGIVDGFITAGGRARLVGQEPLLASPFVKDRRRGDALFAELGFFPFIRAWFDGGIPEDCFVRRAPAAAQQLRAVVDRLASVAADEHAVFVTHDWNIALVREEFLGLRHEDHGWPHYLDGFAVLVDERGCALVLGERAVVVDPSCLQGT